MDTISHQYSTPATMTTIASKQSPARKRLISFRVAEAVGHLLPWLVIGLFIPPWIAALAIAINAMMMWKQRPSLFRRSIYNFVAFMLICGLYCLIYFVSIGLVFYFFPDLAESPHVEFVSDPDDDFPPINSVVTDRFGRHPSATYWDPASVDYTPE